MSDQQLYDADTPPAIPDGIGLDLESVRTLLAQKHATVVDPDDPVLMLVTLQNAFLAEYEKLPMPALIAEAVDMICFIERAPGGRRVSDIVSVNGFDPATRSYDLEHLC